MAKNCSPIFSLRIPPDELSRARAYAAGANLTVGAVLKTALGEYLDKQISTKAKTPAS